MNKEDVIINRIKSILNEVCTNKKHSFYDDDCPIISKLRKIPFNDDEINVHTIKIDNDGIVNVYGFSDMGNYKIEIDAIHYNDICDILNDMERKLGLLVTPTFKFDSFSITSVSREDIANLGYKGADTIPDNIMEKIAQKMADAYVQHSFWSDLDFFVNEYANVEKD